MVTKYHMHGWEGIYIFWVFLSFINQIKLIVLAQLENSLGLGYMAGGSNLVGH
jgi:hypothetical protein